jgi:hypothetical protein
MLGYDEAAMKYVRASILIDTAVEGTHWIGPEILHGLFYEYGKDTYAGFGKGSVPGIEDCIGSDGIHIE